MRGTGTTYEVIRRFYEEERRAISRENAVAAAVRQGVKRDEAEDAIDILLKRGKIYDPEQDDRLKPTTLHP
jgi:DNA replicative helicase MCM subunit Mcm2 (Cdc46/Mcm family)